MTADEDTGDQRDILQAAGGEIETGVDPDAGVGAVLDGKDGAFGVVCGLRIEKDGVPVAAGPGAFAFGAEEGRDAGEGRGDFETEGVDDVGGGGGRLGGWRGDGGGKGEDGQGHLRSLRRWLSVARRVSP